jgi:hypothetical protein
MIASLRSVPHQVLQFTSVKEVGKLHSTAKEFATILLTASELQALRLIRFNLLATSFLPHSGSTCSYLSTFTALEPLRRWARQSIEVSIHAFDDLYCFSPRVVALARQLGEEVSFVTARTVYRRSDC